ncbi:protein ALTERED PHOSPHATE STARVATION RESPONSE 1 isoform X1 [Ricinus communis]|uniref:protein ALTERED PHOSPHATE STARVATION RESPONSE 1 isoform X1 n=1 Tax=Ricinus communis TaxID=3988 RepID=UPI000772B868|nr:protein ALTERED PHOSPHATE STARVATION RESPONSE 1 isoform X1 [Ricinus communis]|eukprot:XP_015579990.1 nitrate regulatory gene2 protein isoform X1 [Ricinus communis]
MGCSTSKLDDEEAVQLCKDRKRFIKQAVEQRTRFATGHLAYIQSLKRVSAALRDYVEGDEPREFLLDSFITPPFTPVKKTSPGFISISPGSFSQPAIQLGANSTLKVNYLRSVGNQAVSVEERPQSPETVRLEAYSPAYQYGYDGYYAMQSSPMYSSFFSYSPNRRPNIPPPSPQTSQWDGFWNPFSSLDYYSYPTRSSLDQMVMDDDIRGLRQVREEEGIPDLEDETEHEETDNKKVNAAEEQAKVDASNVKEEVLVEDVDEDEEDETDSESECGCECENGNSELQSQGSAKIDLSRVQSSGQVEVRSQEMSVGDGEAKAETPAFTVYVNRRPTSMSEVIKDLEDQFIMACNSAKEVSSLLESSKAQYSSMSSELTAMKMLNPVALFRSASSRSSSSRFLVNSSSSRDEGYESNSDFSEESCILSGSHQSTLDRLYAWEKKLYEEVRQSGERIRIAYEKKCMQLRNQDVKGEDPSVVDKTRLAIRDLYTQLQVSIHSAEAVSKRIEALRDEELQPQLLDLVKGLARMWKVMAECHQSQRQTLDAAKLLLAGTPSKLDAKRHSSMSIADPQRLAKSASNLETELRNWRACFEAWITSQRSYMHALTGWLLRCLRSDPDTSKLPFSPRRSSGTFPIFGLCIQWSRFLDVIQEMPVLDGLDFFAAGMGSLYAQQLRDDPTKASSRRYGAGILNESSLNMELVEVGEVEEVMTAEKMAEVAIRVLCAGMSVAASSLTEFSVSSADGYAELVKQWENQPRLLHSSGGTGR